MLVGDSNWKESHEGVRSVALLSTAFSYIVKLFFDTLLLTKCVRTSAVNRLPFAIFLTKLDKKYQ